jgi:flagellar basal body-associated protein FliL
MQKSRAGQKLLNTDINGECIMELIIIILAVVAVMGYFVWRDRKYEESGNHPLDGATKTTTKPDGIGHESIPVQPVISNPLDVNRDGKIDLKDAIAAVDHVAESAKAIKETAKKATEKTTKKVRETVEKATTKKSKSSKK